MFTRRLLPRGLCGNPGRVRRAGASSVEFSVVGLVFVIMVIGVFEMARGFMTQHLLTNAARQGCRIGILPGKSTADITSVVNTSLAGEGVNGDGVSVLVNDGSADASAANSGDEITVTVSVPVSKISWLPGCTYIFGNLSGHYTLRRE